MIRVSKKEFIQYTSKYLKDLPICVTHRGVDDLIVDKASNYDLEEEALRE